MGRFLAISLIVQLLVVPFVFVLREKKGRAESVYTVIAIAYSWVMEAVIVFSRIKG
jgi:hypothetical protein